MPTGLLTITPIELEATLYPLGLHGAPSSTEYNALTSGILSDLATLANTVNSDVLPLLTSLLLSASADGIEGRTVCSDSSDTTSLFYDSVNAVPLSVADSLRILSGQIANILSSIANISVRIDALSTSSAVGSGSSGSANGSYVYDSIATLEAQVNSLQQAVGTYTTTLGNEQSQSVQTPLVYPESIATAVITWASPFLDNSYVVSYALQDDSGFLRLIGFSYLPNGTGIEVRVENHDTVNSYQGFISVIARTLS